MQPSRRRPLIGSVVGHVAVAIASKWTFCSINWFDLAIYSPCFGRCLDGRTVQVATHRWRWSKMPVHRFFIDTVGFDCSIYASDFVYWLLDAVCLLFEAFQNQIIPPPQNGRRIFTNGSDWAWNLHQCLENRLNTRKNCQGIDRVKD